MKIYTNKSRTRIQKVRCIETEMTYRKSTEYPDTYNNAGAVYWQYRDRDSQLYKRSLKFGSVYTNVAYVRCQDNVSCNSVVLA